MPAPPILRLLSSRKALKRYLDLTKGLSGAYIPASMNRKIRGEAVRAAVGMPLSVAPAKRKMFTLRGPGSIQGKSDIGILAHELGHAANSEAVFKLPVLRALRSSVFYGPVASNLAALAGFSPALRGARLASLASLAYAPRLAEEAAASIRGLKAAKAIGIGGKKLRGDAATLGGAFGTYGATAAKNTLMASGVGVWGRLASSLGGNMAVVGLGKRLQKRLAASGGDAIDRKLFSRLSEAAKAGNPYLVRSRNGPLSSAHVRLSPNATDEQRANLAKLFAGSTADPRDAAKLVSREGGVLLGYHPK